MKKTDSRDGLTQEADLSRRNFLKGLGFGLGAASVASLVVAAPVAALAANESAAGGADAGMPATVAPTGAKAILYDASKCVGCHYCEGGCKNANSLPGEVAYDIKALPESVLPKLMIPVEMMPQLNAVQPVTVDDRDAYRWLRVVRKSAEVNGEAIDLFTRNSCTHCGLCAQVCPAKALVQREDGVVTVDPDRCIGCLYCYQACPFDIPRYCDGEPDKAVRKCAMCVQRLDENGQPACVRECPVGALAYGGAAEIQSAGQSAVAALVSAGNADAYLYGERELGGIGVMSVLAYPPATYGLPKLPA
jgi:formate dehydrogenase iron-sulfur subunit